MEKQERKQSAIKTRNRLNVPFKIIRNHKKKTKSKRFANDCQMM